MVEAVLVMGSFVSGLGLIVTLPFAFWKAPYTYQRIILATLYAGIVVVAQYMWNSGTIADETGVSCCSTIPPLYDWGWHILLALSVPTLLFQVYLITRRKQAS